MIITITDVKSIKLSKIKTNDIRCIGSNLKELVISDDHDNVYTFDLSSYDKKSLDIIEVDND